MPTTTTPTPTIPASQPQAPAAPKSAAYKRVLLKLSGEALGGPGNTGLDPAEMDLIATEVKAAVAAGVQMAIVIGGGNFIRGTSLTQSLKTIHQATADYMGMLATIINGMALKEALKAAGVETRVMSAIEIKAVAEPFIRGRALRHLDKGRVVILVAGTGNPFCTTDTCAALRASELDCQVILKATKVDGVYDADPRKNPAAKRFDKISYDHALSHRLAVMDMTAFAMCQERQIPIVVFDFKRPGNIQRVVEGQPVGTLVTTAAAANS
jgi:uridylate kinase